MLQGYRVSKEELLFSYFNSWKKEIQKEQKRATQLEMDCRGKRRFHIVQQSNHDQNDS